MRSRVAAAAMVLATPCFVSAQPPAPRVRIVEELRLDATAEDFPTVSRVVVGPDGEMLVPIIQDMQLRVYDSTGARVAVVGRRGAGPGEFEALNVIGWLGDTLWITDRTQRRTSFIGPEYSLLRTEVWPQYEEAPSGREGRIRFADPMAHRTDGSVLERAFLQHTANRSDDARLVYVLRSPSGARRMLFDAGRSEEDPSMMVLSGFGRPVPFALTAQYAIAYDASRIARLAATLPRGADGSWSVTVVGPRGDTLAARTFPFRGAPIPRRAADSALAAMMPRAGRASEGPVDLPQRFQALARERMPSVYTPVETILLGLDRTIWIGMRPTDEGRLMLILNGRAEPIGMLLLPTSTRVRQATATRVWVTETDADGLSSVVRYRVVGLSCGSTGC
ncbi:MAG TPA: hypothetical protein VLE53_14380 [Gemmatimonadaceae bacterium]|nr:hypothetical protein [Gemmatimonadaceae bacterium]